jgi:uncharacterized protein (UPF0210 family)
VREELRVEAESRAEHTLARLREDLGRLTAQVDAFQEAAGVEITSYRLSSTPEDVARRGAAFKVALEGEDSIERLRQSARWIARSAERLVEQAREIADPPSSEADAA